MIAGGTEAGLDPVAVAAFGNMGALSKRNDEPTASEPAVRSSIVTASSLVKVPRCWSSKPKSTRSDRGARIYCELVSGAVTADAFHISAPLPGGLGAARAMQQALDKAEILPSDLDYICAHGTSTPINDASETEAIKTVFGEAAYKVAISSPKSMIGHLVGAAGAVSGVVCVYAIQNDIVPPTVNLDNPDPDVRSRLCAAYRAGDDRQHRDGERLRVRWSERRGHLQALRGLVPHPAILEEHGNRNRTDCVVIRPDSELRGQAGVLIFHWHLERDGRFDRHLHAHAVDPAGRTCQAASA